MALILRIMQDDTLYVMLIQALLGTLVLAIVAYAFIDAYKKRA